VSQSSSDSPKKPRAPRVPRGLIPAAVYLVVIAATVSIAAVRERAETTRPAAKTEKLDKLVLAQPAKEYKPYFSLSTNRTYSTADRARVWVNYVGLDHLDLRVYRVNDPVKFFRQLANPHKMGDEEKQQIAASQQKSPSFIERLRAFKVSVFKSITGYVRGQLRRESRETLTQKLRGEGDRTPLNVADYAHVPLLNPDQLASSWREKLPPLDSEYDTRMIMLGKRDPGVYLVEAVNGELRAYTIAIVSDLTMIRKTTDSGQVLVSVVERNSGAPREGARIEIVHGKKTLAQGATDRSGIYKTRVQPPKRAQEQASEDVDYEAERERAEQNTYVITARDRDHFAISDLEYYFGYWGYEGEGEGYEGEGYTIGGITSYIYTDRPIYRPAQKVYFKGILRRGGEKGYELVTGPVNVTIEDPDGGKVIEKQLSLSSRGTFSGDVDIAAGARLGQYRIVAQSGESRISGYFEVQEYKKPEYKVTVAASKKFVRAGEKVKFSIDAKYFFGEPVKNADVTYYIYRSHYYPWWWESEEDREDTEESETGDEGYGYGNDMVKDGQATLNAKGHLDIEFEVPEADQNRPWDYTYRLEAQVTDEARRVIEGKASFVGTRGGIVASIRTDRYVYYEGDTARIRIQTNDYDGNPLSGALTLEFFKRTWERIETGESAGKYPQYEYRVHEERLSSVNVNTDQRGEATYDFAVPGPGSVYINAIVTEGKKQFVATTDYLWIADKKGLWSDWAYESYGSIKLVPDKKSYAPGETAHVLAMLPTDKAHLLVTTELMGVMTARHVEAPGRAVMIAMSRSNPASRPTCTSPSPTCRTARCTLTTV